MPRATKEQKSVEAIREEAAAFARAAFKEEGPWWVVIRLRHKPVSGSQLRWKRLPDQTTANAWQKYFTRNADKYSLRRDACGHPAAWIQNFRPEPYQEHES